MKMTKTQAKKVQAGDMLHNLPYHKDMTVQEVILTPTVFWPRGKFPLFVCEGEGDIPFSYLHFEGKK